MGREERKRRAAVLRPRLSCELQGAVAAARAAPAVGTTYEDGGNRNASPDSQTAAVCERNVRQSDVSRGVQGWNGRSRFESKGAPDWPQQQHYCSMASTR